MLETIKPPLDFFPLESPPREKQAKALDFIWRAIDSGYTDIVIEAPTGLGKTAVAAAVCLWAGQFGVLDPKFRQGGYYLCTQKLLQDQLTEDIRRYKPHLRDAASLKSATEYECVQYGNCMIGRKMKKERTCSLLSCGKCPYAMTRERFLASRLAITNYPFHFAERTFSGQFPARKIACYDECHSIEKNILNFVEVLADTRTLREWAPALRLGKMDSLNQFYIWLREKFLPVLETRMHMLEEALSVAPDNDKMRHELMRLETYVGRCSLVMQSIQENPRNWVYWQEQDEHGGLRSVAKPIQASQFAPYLIRDAAQVRVYLSAYIGPKEIFCRSLGLDPDKVTGARYGSTFPVENRPIHMTFVGSMSHRNAEVTLPSMLRQIERIAHAHPDEKGLLHVHKYSLGKSIADYLKSNGLAERVLFPANAKERNEAYEFHIATDKPTILISPSMAEGFDMVEDRARWQCIVKIPFPFLLDLQVKAKKDADPEWYTLQTVSTFLQACGRIVRSDTDCGKTYVLDEDFKRLYREHERFFPRWFSQAFLWH